MRHLENVRRERIFACHKVQATVDYAEFSTLQPDQAMAIRMGDAGSFQP